MAALTTDPGNTTAQAAAVEQISTGEHITPAEATQHLVALSKVPPPALAYLAAHGPAVQRAAADSPRQWQTWYWICFGAAILFVLGIPLLRGRWNPRQARLDAEAHEQRVQAELAQLPPTAA